MNIAYMLQRLDEAQNELAKSALQQPSARDSFEYGRVVGMHAGLTVAKEILLSIYQDREERDNSL